MSLNRIICGRSIQYFILVLIIIFDILYFVYGDKASLFTVDKYNIIENLLIGSICIASILILSLILSYGSRQLLYTTILLNVGLMAISIYTLTLLTDLPDQKENLKVVIFSYMASIIGAVGGFISIASCLLMLNARC